MAAVATGAALLIVTQSTWAGMSAKVTGGAETITALGVVFSMTANGIETPNGLKGNIQYSREANNGAMELYVHANVACMWISPDGSRAELGGPAMVQSNPTGLATDDWFRVAIAEGGTGSGDSVRAHFVAAGTVCDGEKSFLVACWKESSRFVLQPVDEAPTLTA
jgi:hypothetical protein